MKTEYSKKPVLLVGAILIVACMTACSAQKGESINEKESESVMEIFIDTQIPLESDVKKSENNGDVKKSEDNAEIIMEESSQEKDINVSDTNPEEMFESANLSGDVKIFNEKGFSLVPVHESQNGEGQEAAIAAPGAESEEDLVNISYENGVIFQVLTMDREKQSVVSITEVNQDTIKKGTSVLIFGTCQDTYSWTASKVVIVRWQ